MQEIRFLVTVHYLGSQVMQILTLFYVHVIVQEIFLVLFPNNLNECISFFDISWQVSLQNLSLCSVFLCKLHPRSHFSYKSRGSSFGKIWGSFLETTGSNQGCLIIMAQTEPETRTLLLLKSWAVAYTFYIYKQNLLTEISIKLTRASVCSPWSSCPRCGCWCWWDGQTGSRCVGAGKSVAVRGWWASGPSPGLMNPSPPWCCQPLGSVVVWMLGSAFSGPVSRQGCSGLS